MKFYFILYKQKIVIEVYCLVVSNGFSQQRRGYCYFEDINTAMSIKINRNEYEKNT